VLLGRHNDAEAEPLLASAYADAKAAGVTANQWAYAMNYGTALARIGKHVQAVAILLEADHAARSHGLASTEDLRTIADALVRSYEALNNSAEAAAWRAKRDAPPATQPLTAPVTPAATSRP
jgi:hypothetical protein